MVRLGAGEEATEDLVDAIIVSRHEVTYRAPLLFGPQPVLIECWVTELRAGSFTLAYEVFHEDEAGERVVYLEASTVLAPYRFDTESPRRLTAEERAALEVYLDPVEARAAGAVRHRSGSRRGTTRSRCGSATSTSTATSTTSSTSSTSRKRGSGCSWSWVAGCRGPARSRWSSRRPTSTTSRRSCCDADAYDCWSQIAHVGRTSLVIESEIADGDRTLARARVVLVFFDPETQRPAAPPADYQERLRAALG